MYVTPRVWEGLVATRCEQDMRVFPVSYDGTDVAAVFEKHFDSVGVDGVTGGFTLQAVGRLVIGLVSCYKCLRVL